MRNTEFYPFWELIFLIKIQWKQFVFRKCGLISRKKFLVGEFLGFLNIHFEKIVASLIGTICNMFEKCLFPFWLKVNAGWHFVRKITILLSTILHSTSPLLWNRYISTYLWYIYIKEFVKNATTLVTRVTCFNLPQKLCELSQFVPFCKSLKKRSYLGLAAAASFEIFCN